MTLTHKEGGIRVSSSLSIVYDQNTKEINGFFAPKKRFVNEVYFDKFYTDADIKQFLEVHLGAINWGMLPKDVRKACYMNYKSEASLPRWNLITRETY